MYPMISVSDKFRFNILVSDISSVSERTGSDKLVCQISFESDMSYWSH
jgi:hypothetical protein